MGGGLMQLVAYGAQDIYLTGNPQITFFKVVYRRHTNFSMEAIEQTISGSSGLDKSGTITISRNGDLIHSIFMDVTVNSTLNITIESAAAGTADQLYNYGHDLLDNVVLEIGGQEIDKQYGDWMQVWHDLTDDSHVMPTPGGAVTIDTVVATRNDNVKGVGLQHIGLTNQPLSGSVSTVSGRITVPLQFWVCKNPGLALPLIALQYHEVKLKVNWNKTGFGFVGGFDHSENKTASKITADASSYKFFVDYIYLDTDERRRFAQVSHEYLIEQVQRDIHTVAESSNVINKGLNLNFNHPVKELIWVGRCTTLADGGSSDHEKRCYSSQFLPVEDTGNIKLIMNGHDRMAPRPPTYYSRTQIYQYHKGRGGITFEESNNLEPVVYYDAISVYSFALKPEEHQPSGTCNFSRLDNVQLDFNGAGMSGGSATCGEIIVYAVNYNVLRIMSGMGGLAYSN